MSRELWKTLSQFARRRRVFLAVVGSIAILAFVIWNIAAGLASFENELSTVSVEEVVDGEFLGIQVADYTRDQYISNASLRLAMNEGFTKSKSVRKYQMETIWLQEGQHPDTGAPAVLVTVEPKKGEIPSPPFLPVAVRRWEPDPNTEYALDDLPEMRRVRPSNEEDLARLREVWSGGQIARSNLFGRWIRRLFVFLALGMALMVVAGAYRALAWRSSRWDRAADAERHDAALKRLQSARDNR